MESYMVDNYFDNSNIILQTKYVFEIIENYFNINLKKFFLIKKSHKGPFWYIKYTNDEMSIVLKGDVGFSVSIIIDNTTFFLWQFDKRLHNTTKTNKKNILFTLKILNKFIHE